MLTSDLAMDVEVLCSRKVPFVNEIMLLIPPSSRDAAVLDSDRRFSVNTQKGWPT